MMKKKLIIILVGILLFLPINVRADSGILLTCPDSINTGSTLSCGVYLNTDSTLSTISGVYSFNTGVTYNSFVVDDQFTSKTINESGFELSTGEDISAGRIALGILKMDISESMTSNATIYVSVTATDTSNNQTYMSISKEVTVKSTENRLATLSVDSYSLTPSFDLDTTNYSVTIDDDDTSENIKVNITATAKSKKSSISGTGEKTITFGDNSFNIVVESESGSIKTYYITIHRNDNRSSDCSLKSLSLSGMRLSFNKDTTLYSMTTTLTSTTISATANSDKATVTGDIGSKSLSVGLNTYNITVTAENGATKTYTIKITRSESNTYSSNNYLSSLIVTNTSISFNKNTTTYNLTTNSSETYISAIKDDSKATMTGDTGSHSLSYGANKFVIKVEAENGDIRTYVINITRSDSKSSNNYLKSLSLSTGTISFNKDTITYDVDVDKDTSSVEVKAEVEDSKSSFVSGYGPKTVTLQSGNNTVYIKVQAENGEVRTYTININRDDGRDSDSSLKTLKLSSGKIKFDKDTLEYKVNVEYGVETIKITAEATSEKAKVTITGDEKLIVGENVFNVVVEAENGKTTTYVITIVRKEEGYKVSTNNKIKKLTIKGHSIDFKKNKYKYIVKTKDDKLVIKVTLDDESADYEIIGNSNLKNGSKILIKVTAESGDERIYTIEIKKTNIGLILLIIGIIIVSGGIGVCIYFLIKMKKNKKPQEIISVQDFNKK